MATTISPGRDRIAGRRSAVVEQMLDHAEEVLREDGAGAVTVSEVARRTGIRPPSVYKYFSSLHAIHDALFARGQLRLLDTVESATVGMEPGLPRLLEGQRAFLRWVVSEPALAALMFWRPVPGFVPSAEAYAPALLLLSRAREEVRAAVTAGQLRAGAASDEAFRMLTVLVTGIFSQQLANEPGADFATGAFTSLTDEVLHLWVDRYAADPPKGRSRP